MAKKRKSKVGDTIAEQTIPRVGTTDYARYAARGDNNSSAIMGGAAVIHDKTKYLDPGYWLLGKDRYQGVQDFIGHTSPTWFNRTVEPISAFHRQYLDPIQWFVPEDSELQQAPDWAQNKSGDVMAAILASYFGAAALGGGGSSPLGLSNSQLTGAYSQIGNLPSVAGFQGGGTMGAGGAAAGGTTGFAGMDWTNPQTYTRMGNMMPRQQAQSQSSLPSMLTQMQLQQQQSEMQAEMERLERERQAQEQQRRLAMAGLIQGIYA